MRKIPLTMGMVALVDRDDWPEVSQYTWRAVKNRNTYYARTGAGGGKGKGIYMHRLLCFGELVDHRNGNGLDNRRQNLRPATRSQNLRNRRKHRGNFTSRFKGVSRHRRKWIAWLSARPRRYLGTFETEQEAARAYDSAALEDYGEFALTNLQLGLLPA